MAPLRWILAPDPGPVQSELAERLDISDLLARLLAQRLPEPSVETARAFLRPSLGNLHSPWLLPDMEIAADRIARAVRDRERIVVHGDYDTDGVTATALLLRIFRALGHPAVHRLPSRMEEGYGISAEFARGAAADGTRLVITVDCGISEHETIGMLNASGVDVIVTDHHEPPPGPLPLAMVLVDPKRADSDYPFREMTGVGLAFKLAWAVCERVVGSPQVGERLQRALLDLLPLVAVGTVADVAPLVDENRICVAYGLQAFHRAFAGLEALAQTCDLDAATLTVRDIAFGISPRLNAAGRMGNAEAALQLLLADEPEPAARIAGELDRQNGQRQKLCQAMQEEALELARSTHDLAADPAVVVAREGWHEGVIGIVAGRLAEDLFKPTAVIALAAGEKRGRGSARSIPGINLYEAMNRARGCFLSFGGHEQAAGFSIASDRVDEFRRLLQEQCREQMASRRIEPSLRLDAAVDLAEINDRLLREIDRLAPFGQGNPPPCLLARNIRVAGTPRLMGKENKHFSFHAAQHEVAYRAVVFNNTEWLRQIDDGAREWDIAFTPSLNSYWSPPRLELRVADMRPADDGR